MKLKIIILILLTAAGTRAEWTEPVMLGPNVNGGGEDYYPCLSLDGQDLYFTGMYMSGYGDDDIYVCHWQGDEWGPHENLGPVINSSQRDLSPSISPDGDTLYFVSYGRPGGYGWYDIWKSWKTETGWAEPVNMGPNINTVGMEWTVYIAPDNNHLYFASDCWPPYSALDLYVCTRTDSGWSLPQNLINLSSYSTEYSTTMTADMQTMYFTKWYYNYEIFTSEWNGDNWTSETNIGPPINTNAWDHCPTVSADGNTLYFVRQDTNDYDDDIFVSYWISGAEEREKNIISDFVIVKCYPNPFNQIINIEFNIKKDSPVWLRIYNLEGKEVYSYYFGFISAGNYAYIWEGQTKKENSIGSGVYFMKILTGVDSYLIKKIICLK